LDVSTPSMSRESRGAEAPPLHRIKGHDRVGSRHGASIHTELLSSLNPFHLPQSARLRTWTALTSLVARVGLERIRRRTFQLLS
jgi:hypothetical protein